MAGSGTRGDDIVNLNNMENKAPAETYELFKKQKNKNKNKKKRRKKKKPKKQKSKRKKEVHTFSNRGLRCSWKK